jgi:hypothetical protein
LCKMKDMKSPEWRIPEESPQEESPEEAPKETSSFFREIALGTAAFASMGTVPAYGQDITPIPFVESLEASSVEAIPQIENIIEERNFGEHFTKEQVTYTTLYRDLTNKQVMFVDEKGLLIGQPISLDPIMSSGTNTVIIPGTLDARGVPVGRVSQTWLDAARVRVCEEAHIRCNTEESLPRVRSVIRLVRDATPYFSQGATPPETFFDIIRHLGSSPVPGIQSEVTLIQYIHENFGKNTNLPPDILEELRDTLPGLAAQESQYNPAARSPVGARGILQFMPDTWRTMGYSRDTEGNSALQVEAAGKYFEGSYRELMTRNSEDFAYIRTTFFGGDTTAFDKYFLVPVLINTYNSGTGRLSRVITWFRNTYPDRQSISSLSSGENGYGYDVYAAMAHFASENKTAETSGYKEHSSEYFSRVFALANIISEYEDGALLRRTEPPALTVSTEN